MATFSLDAVEIFGQGVLQAEGVVIDKDGNVYGGGRNGIIYKVSPEGQVSELVTLPAGSIPNGITLDRQGNLVYCDLGKKAVMRVTQSGQVSMIADRVGTLALTLPNFASYDADGNLYVSNSSTRDINSALVELTKPEPNGALVRIRPDGKGEIVATGIYLANGTAIDPKEEAVYVLESTRDDCLRIAIKKDGTFGKPEIYAQDFPALPDGMAFDVAGNLYVTLPGKAQNGTLVPANQIIQVDTNGKWTLLIDDPAGQKLALPTNCAFGGPGLQDLYIANLEGDHFTRVHTPFRGHPLYHQR
jgi:gluconolactonase